MLSVGYGGIFFGNFLCNWNTSLIITYSGRKCSSWFSFSFSPCRNLVRFNQICLLSTCSRKDMGHKTVNKLTLHRGIWDMTETANIHTDSHIRGSYQNSMPQSSALRVRGPDLVSQLCHLLTLVLYANILPF